MASTLHKIQTPLIPLGVSVDSFTNLGSTDIWNRLGLDSGAMILYFGRLSEMSKVDLVPLIFEFSQVREAGHDAWLVLAGDDTQLRCAEQLRDAASRLGCANRVRVIAEPNHKGKATVVRASDIFVALSDSLQKTFGITVVEAMAAGLPVIAPDWDGYRDTVVHGETGYLIPTILPIFPSQFDFLRGSGNMVNFNLLSATTSVSVPALREAIEKHR